MIVYKRHITDLESDNLLIRGKSGIIMIVYTRGSMGLEKEV